MGQAIGRDRVIMPTIGGDHPVASLLPATEVLFAHEPADPLASMPLARSSQASLDARGTINAAALLMETVDFPLELLVLPLALPGLSLALAPVVIPAGRNLKGIAQLPDGMLGFQCVDPPVALFGLSERVAKVFLKCPAVGPTLRSHAAAPSVRFPGPPVELVWLARIACAIDTTGSRR